jgi:hypothetical protein
MVGITTSSLKILAPEPDAHYPRCLKGKLACPPEDCGGIWGYYGLLETIKARIILTTRTCSNGLAEISTLTPSTWI